ncbi:MAG: ribulose-phosphate 3-epimerase [Bacteroidota bacterium]|nr:ribulose-phosphate 3-epimerase [Bacteroidota bacterium]
MSTFILAPSLLSCDFSKIGDESKLINESEADWFHLDIMDGRFVPNISFGLPIVQAFNEHATKPLDVHLMIADPQLYIEDFRNAGADSISVHYEACPHLHRVIQQIKDSGSLAGVALNPHTPVQLLFDVLEDIDMVCLMSVNPGFGGQKFIYRTLEKIRILKSEIMARNLTVKIEVDGGVGLQNAEVILRSGADVLVAGNAIFKTKDPKSSIQAFKQISTGNLIF